MFKLHRREKNNIVLIFKTNLVQIELGLFFYRIWLRVNVNFGVFPYFLGRECCKAKLK